MNKYKTSNENFLNVIKLLTESLPIDEEICQEKGVTLDVLECVINNLEEFLSLPHCSLSKSNIVLKLSEVIILFGLVKTFKGEDRDFSHEDFPHTAEYAEKSFQLLKILIKELKLLESSHKRRFIVNVLLLCSTHNKLLFWSNETTVSLSKDVLSTLLENTQHKTLSNLLCDESFYPTVFKEVLKRMRPSLMKDSWMHNPSSCHMFYWFLTNVKHPYLVDYLPDIFPPPLMFISYLGTPQRVLGIQCIDHMLENIPPTIMKLNGKEDVIHHSFHPITYSKDPEIVAVLYPCILKLPMMQIHKVKLVYWSEYDKMVDHLLFNAEMENNVQLKRLFFCHILSFLELMPPFKHLKHLMVVLKSTFIDFVYEDIQCQVTGLKILKVVIKSCWPRMEHHCFQILIFLCELSSSQHCNSSNEINVLCEECCVLLKHACREKFLTLTENYIMEDGDLPGVQLLKKVLSGRD